MGGIVGTASERSVLRVLHRSLTLVLGQREVSVATDDALAEVSTNHESANAERSWTRDLGTRAQVRPPGLPALRV
jgi:hypothetical protein